MCWDGGIRRKWERGGKVQKQIQQCEDFQAQTALIFKFSM